MKVLAIIPARGGSKGFPGKNLAKVGGKSLFEHAASVLNKTKTVNRIIVSTDSEKIAEHAQTIGLEVPFMRPAELAEDAVTDCPVFQHALSWLKNTDNYIPDIIVQVAIVAPFAFKRNQEGTGNMSSTWNYIPRDTIIDQVVSMLSEKKGLDSVRTVHIQRETPYTMWKFDGDQIHPFIDTMAEEIYNMPRQKHPPVYLQNGYAIASRYQTIMEKNSMHGEAIGGYVVDCDYFVDIDHYEDIELAELLYQQIMKG